MGQREDDSHRYGDCLLWLEGQFELQSIDGAAGRPGEFDVAIFGSILLHLERPLRALAAAAERSKTLVVCEPLGPFAATADEKLMRPLPASDRNLTGWWQIAPGALVDMLEILGFGDFELTSHRQRHHVEHDVSSEQVDVDMYTLVARKNTDQ